MANVSLIQDDCMDDSDEGFDQGDCSVGTPEDDSSLQPLLNLMKDAQSTNAIHRQMAVRLVRDRDMSKMSPAETLTAEMPEIMKTLLGIGDESIADLLNQIPHVAIQDSDSSNRENSLKNVVSEYLTPLVVRNLGSSDAAVNKAARDALFQLIEQGYINKQQAEIQVCPSVLALSKVDTILDVNTGAISLMSKLASLLGRDITERIFLKRFSELCESPLFYIRKICAAHMGEFSRVVGKESFENVLLFSYVKLCSDDVWNVRKACAEVVMFLSFACDDELRKSTLTPVFVQLLQDECRWVRMSAFQALGSFISTFAVPTITNLEFNKAGDLVMVNEEGIEFTINFSRTLSMSEKYSIMNEGKKKMGVITYDDEDQQEVQQGGDDKENQEPDNKVAPPSENGLIDMVDEMLSIIDSNSEPAPSDDSTLVVVDSLGEKVNTGCDDDLHMFNSHSYWYVSPDMPLDPFIVAGGDAANAAVTASTGFPDVAAHLEDLYSTINLSNSLDSTKPNPDDSTLSLEKFSGDGEEPTPSEETSTAATENTVPSQQIVPEQLVRHYVSMTDPALLDIDNEMSYHCAYFLPAVASTLGSNNWHLLKDTVDALAGDMQYRVRKSVASSLYGLAVILGPEITTDHLAPLFEGFLKDLDEVRVGVLGHLALFLKLISASKRASYLPRLGEFLQIDNESNWRFREELARQLLDVLELFKPVEAAKHVWNVGMSLLADKVAAVRQAAMVLMTQIVKHTSTEPGLTPRFLLKIAENFAHSKNWRRRQTFCLLCGELLNKLVLPAEQFASEMMPHLLDLSWDPVANVRLVVARCISQNILKNDYFMDPSNEQLDGLETVLRRLQADKDVDVRQCAEL